ncbi:MAG TPA: GTPase Era [Gemmatimonadales bacterium]|nr:GTPase Era [Gemmatimonadales bacterium]
MPDAVTRFATIALAGRPNVGKSSLLNALVGESLAIVSPKPQSSRLPVVGLRTVGDVQLALVDPPGLLDPAYLMQHAMLAAALDVLDRADAILHLHPAPEGEPPPLASLLPPDRSPRRPVLVVLTKCDLASRTAAGPGRLAVSAVTGAGLPELTAWCEARAVPGPFRYPADDLSTQPARFFVAEYVREAAFERLGDEVPYALAAEVDEFREGSTPLYIRVALYTERDSQKAIVVGKGGRAIRDIGARARRRIEAFLGTPVYLDLWVKTVPRWRSRAGVLRRLGFETPPKRHL